MFDKREIADGAAHWRGTLGKPGPEVRTPDQRRTDIRREVEAEVMQADVERQEAQERASGAAAAEHALRHAKAVSAPRDPRPAEPVGAHRTAPDGTVWKRTA